MKYLVELNGANGKMLQTFGFSNDAGLARMAFTESLDHPFAAESLLVSVSETGTRVTLDRAKH